MSRFFAASSSESESSEEEELYSGEEAEKSEDETTSDSDDDDSDDSDSDSDSDGATGVNRFLKSEDEDSEDEEEEEKSTVVKSAKDKKFEELEGTVRLIENAQKIGDWTVISAGLWWKHVHDRTVLMDLQNTTNSIDSFHA